VNLAYKIQHLWFCTVESSVRVQDFGCAGVGCVFCVLAATWVWSGNYCFNRGRRYLRKMQRRLVSTKLTTSCQWKKMVSPILSIIFLVEVATLQSCSIHFLARSVATLIKKWAKVVDLLWSFCFWQEDFAYMFPWWWGLIGIFGLFWIGDRCHERLTIYRRLTKVSIWLYHAWEQELGCLWFPTLCVLFPGTNVSTKLGLT
jgi:hypothetical protein